jgi:hypothetical protein
MPQLRTALRSAEPFGSLTASTSLERRSGCWEGRCRRRLASTGAARTTGSVSAGPAFGNASKAAILEGEVYEYRELWQEFAGTPV